MSISEQIQIIIGSFNVMTLKEKSKTFPKIKELIMNNHIDILGFQEITEKALQKLAQELNMNYLYSREGYQGNGILSKYPIKKSRTIFLKINQLKVLTRNCQYVVLETPIGEISFANTHLDHLFEDIRLQQYQIIQSELINNYNIDFLVGDFNTQYLKDYSNEKLEIIQKHREEAKLEKVLDKTVKMILSDNFQINKFIGATCPYNTRVDYIFYKKDILSEKVQLEHSIIECISNHISDHNLILVSINNFSLHENLLVS